MVPPEPPFPPAFPVEAMIDRHFSQPGIQCGVLTEGMDLPEYGDEHLLNDLPAFLRVQGDAPGHLEQAFLKGVDQNGKRFPIPLPELIHQVLFIHNSIFDSICICSGSLSGIPLPVLPGSVPAPHPAFFPVSIPHLDFFMPAADPVSFAAVMARVPTGFKCRFHPDPPNFPADDRLPAIPPVIPALRLVPIGRWRSMIPLGLPVPG